MDSPDDHFSADDTVARQDADVSSPLNISEMYLAPTVELITAAYRSGWKDIEITLSLPERPCIDIEFQRNLNTFRSAIRKRFGIWADSHLDFTARGELVIRIVATLSDAVV